MHWDRHRFTEDSLGPLIGYNLKEKELEYLEVLGTLECPVHAMNLETYQTILRLRYPNHVLVAVRQFFVRCKRLLII